MVVDSWFIGEGVREIEGTRGYTYGDRRGIRMVTSERGCVDGSINVDHLFQNILGSKLQLYP